MSASTPDNDDVIARATRELTRALPLEIEIERLLHSDHHAVRVPPLRFDEQTEALLRRHLGTLGD